MLKIGLMGCGKVAGYGHLPAIAKSAKLDVFAIYDPDEGRLCDMQRKFDVPFAYTDVDRFMQSGIDAVVITSPAPFHLQNVVDAARYGKPVLCEKPLAMDEAEAKEMIRLADEAGVALYTAFDYRFSPVSLQIKQLVQSGEIGEVRLLRLVYIWNLHGKYGTDELGRQILNQRREGRMEEGGPLVDCGVHQIDLARWWLGSEVTRYEGDGVWIDDSLYEAPDHMYVRLDHASGAKTMVEMSFSYGHTAKEPLAHFTYDLIGTEGIIRYDRREQVFEMRNSKGTTRFPFAGEKNFAGMYDAFADALQTGDPGMMPTARDGLMATWIARTATDEAIGKKRGETSE
ncbi:Gfo/Idh/MocA family protein [Paenibacillus ginsengarvi]|nr:Gfo/Idh/MocA family oxidoreductase [Paenibacillus ginsengarvi]